ncbi:MAG TPA: ABC transporter permease [Gemmataceae bacterium]|nr:ABC transporter permease [Gemmataceae bacterium]
MIRAIFWKEFREQWVVALAILLFGGLALALMAEFTDAAAGSGWVSLGAREVMPAGLAYLAGAVCGAILLADEKEVGTLEFLDTLPSRRRDLWIGKALFGLTATVLQAVVIGGLSAALRIDARFTTPGYVVSLVMVGLVAFGWGMFGGALARSVLGAVFMGSLWIGPVAIAVAVAFALAFGGRQVNRMFSAVQGIAYALTLAGIGLAGAGWWFTRPDRDRLRPPEVTPAGRRVHAVGRGWFPGLRALVWLSARQAVWITVGAAACALLAGAGMLAPDAQPLFTWPALTLILGVTAGVTALGEEQVRGVAQFWAERRLPLGRLWLVKVVVHFVIAVGAGLIAYAMLLAGSWDEPFRTRLVVELRPEYGRFLLLALVYGFVFGHLAGMAFRKAVVGSLVAVVTAAAFAGLLIPEVIGGGAQWWQVWGPAVVLLLTARVLVYPWATGRVLTRGPVWRGIAGTAAAFLVLGAGIGYRVLQVPDVPDRLAESGFEARIPLYDDDEGRRTARSALSQFRAAYDGARPLLPTAPAQPAPALLPALPATPVSLERIAAVGWSDEADAFRPWLDQVFEGDWVRVVVPPGRPRPAVKGTDPDEKDRDTARDREFAPVDPAERFDRPPWKLGILEDPRNQSLYSPQAEEDARTLQWLAAAVRARGVQQARDGRPVSMLRLARGGLAVARTGRNMGGWTAVRAAFAAEETLLGGIQEWAAGAAGRPDLLRHMLAVLDQHEREMPVGAEDTAWADHLILRTTLEQVESWSAALMARRTRGRGEEAEPAEAEAKLVAFAWSVPWERVRRERILRMYTNPGSVVPFTWLSRLHRLRGRQGDLGAAVEGRDRTGLTHRRATRLIVALHLYRAETGRPAADLGDLVPDYLPAVPDNPLGGPPFRYRVSPGEVLGLPDREARAYYRAGEWDVLGAMAGLSVPPGVPWLVAAGLLREYPLAQAPWQGGRFVDTGVARSQPRQPIVIDRGTGLLTVAGPADPVDRGRRSSPPPGLLQVDNDWMWRVPGRKATAGGP